MLTRDSQQNPFAIDATVFWVDFVTMPGTWGGELDVSPK